MSMNKVSGNMYREILGQNLTHTWNPLGGKCPHECTYCSTQKLMRYPVIKKKYSGPPKLCENTLQDNLGSGNFIFVVAQNDLFAHSIPDEYIEKVLAQCRKYPDNKYLFQSKNPVRFWTDFKFPYNTILATTIESNRQYDEISTAPPPIDRAFGISVMKIDCEFVTMITVEPVLDFDLDEFVKLLKSTKADQINVGAVTGGHKLPEPSKEKLDALIKAIKPHLKSNIKRLTQE